MKTEAKCTLVNNSLLRFHDKKNFCTKNKTKKMAELVKIPLKMPDHTVSCYLKTKSCKIFLQ